jgi:putative ATPase
LAPKSNAATTAINQARHDVREQKIIPVPKHLRDGHYAGAKKLDRGIGYQYAHQHPDGVVAQSYLGVDREYYQPVPRGFEQQLRERIRALRQVLRGESPDPSS